MILTGISCRDDMFKIRNVHISLFATPLGTAFVFPRFFSFLLVSSNSSRLSIAFSPAGVAAHPNPKTLAIILVAIYSFAGCSDGICGKKKRSTGFIFPANPAMMPAFSAIFISPTQNAITPVIVIQSVTASFAESSAASVTSGSFPVNAANTTPIRIINAHR